METFPQGVNATMSHQIAPEIHQASWDVMVRIDGVMILISTTYEKGGARWSSFIPFRRRHHAGVQSLCREGRCQPT